MNEYRSLRVALLGAGSVGSQVARLLLERGDEYEARVGARLELAGIGVRNVHAQRDVELPEELLTDDLEKLVASSDIVIELMGGIEPARTLLLGALKAGADVVTANKALVAAHGPELHAAAATVGAQLSFEAAVGGAIPIIRPLEASLAGDRVNRVMGIVNGTTNYILDKMHREGASLEEALRVATELGYAEADPTADIEGFDAASKATILASLAFHTTVPVESVYREGITGITADMVAQAEKDGRVIKLLAICERVNGDGGERVNARVYPALVAADHPLAAVHEAKNAIFVEAEAAGDLMFYGAGAGGIETASAVLGDLVSLARRHIAGGPGTAVTPTANLTIAPMDEVVTRYQVTLEVRDQPGVMSRLAGLFGDNGVSMESIEQRSSDDEALATLVVGTHAAKESDLQSVITALAEHSDVVSVSSFVRAEAV